MINCRGVLEVRKLVKTRIQGEIFSLSGFHNASCGDGGHGGRVLAAVEFVDLAGVEAKGGEGGLRSW